MCRKPSRVLHTMKCPRGDQSSPCGTIPHEVGERITVTSPSRSYEVEDGSLGAGVLPQDLGFACRGVWLRLLPVVANNSARDSFGADLQRRAGIARLFNAQLDE